MTEAEAAALRAKALANIFTILESHCHNDRWPRGPWTFEDQMAANAEGWALSIFLKNRHEYGKILPSTDHRLDVFGGSTEKAIAFVKARAEQGSDLHQRALVLHITATLKLNA